VIYSLALQTSQGGADRFYQRRKVLHTAGVSAGIDLALALVEEDLGHSVAATVARELVLFPETSRQPSAIQRATRSTRGVDDKRMRDLPAWARSSLTRKLDVSTLAKVVAMSPRTFARQFQSQFGTTRPSGSNH